MTRSRDARGRICVVGCWGSYYVMIMILYYSFKCEQIINKTLYCSISKNSKYSNSTRHNFTTQTMARIEAFWGGKVISTDY